MRTEFPSSSAAVDGWKINIPDQPTAISAIVSAAKAGKAFTVFTLNLDHLVKLRTSEPFRRAYEQATFVTADGEPVARLARRGGARIVRTTGADLVLPLAAACAEADLPIFLFGTSGDVLATAGWRLVQNTQNRLEVVGSMAPGYGFDPEGADADAAIDRIAASGAKICFVALGAPKQEIFSARAQARGLKIGFICIGGGLDFLSGEQIRAPNVFQRFGLEWLWRLLSNPRRFAARYAQCAVLLAELVFVSPFAGSASSGRPST